MSGAVLPMFSDPATIPEAPEPVSDFRWTEALLVGALRSRYGGNEWALITQVRDGAGWDRRTFDAIAIGLWGSRGHPVHGFECKVSRSDWKRELAQPAKAEPLAAFCDRWWIVAPRGVVPPSTLPETWGLMEARGPEGPIVTVVEATKRDAKPPTPGFVAQLAKRLLAERPSTVELEAAEERGYQRGKEQGESSKAWERDRAKDRLEALEERVRVFQESSGLSLETHRGDDLKRYAEIVRQVSQASMGWDSPLRRLDHARAEAKRFLDATDAWQNGEAKP
jgi:hypothetical protein